MDIETWKSTKPDKFVYLQTVTVISDKYTMEMDEDFTVSEHHTDKEDDSDTVVQVGKHTLFAVQINILLLFLPGETLDINILISL